MKLINKWIYAIHDNKPCDAQIIDIVNDEYYVVKIYPYRCDPIIIKTTNIKGLPDVSAIQKSRSTSKNR